MQSKHRCFRQRLGALQSEISHQERWCLAWVPNSGARGRWEGGTRRVNDEDEGAGGSRVNLRERLHCLVPTAVGPGLLLFLSQIVQDPLPHRLSRAYARPIPAPRFRGQPAHPTSLGPRPTQMVAQRRIAAMFPRWTRQKRGRVWLRRGWCRRGPYVTHIWQGGVVA